MKMDYKVDIIAKNSCSTIGEGPHWEENSQSLLYVDMYVGDLHRWDSTTGKDETIHLPGKSVNVIVPCKSGGYLVNQSNTIQHYSWENNSLKELHRVENDERDSFNDGKCDASGRFWNGTMFYIGDSETPAPAEKNTHALYSLETDGQLVKRLDGVSLSNGLAWSADNSTMFYTDSYSLEISAFDFDIDSGSITNRRSIYKYPFDMEKGVADGMTIDTEGKLWVAMFGSSKVIRIDPETGTVIQSVELPGVKNITSCCFGGKNYDDLFVTTASMFQEDCPNKGSIFRVHGLGVKGLPAVEYGR